MRATDLKDLVRLSQVLAFAILDDGWLGSEQREELETLWNDLNCVTRRWGTANHASTKS